MSINGLEVTNVNVYEVKNKSQGSKLAAFARVNLNDNFIVSGIRIFEGDKGPYIMFPKDSRNEETGNNYDVCFPITAALRTYITEEVLTQYSDLFLEPANA